MGSVWAVAMRGRTNGAPTMEGRLAQEAVGGRGLGDGAAHRVRAGRSTAGDLLRDGTASLHYRGRGLTGLRPLGLLGTAGGRAVDPLLRVGHSGTANIGGLIQV